MSRSQDGGSASLCSTSLRTKALCKFFTERRALTVGSEGDGPADPPLSWVRHRMKRLELDEEKNRRKMFHETTIEASRDSRLLLKSLLIAYCCAVSG